MKVVVTPPSTKEVECISGSTRKRAVVLVLVASFISFSSAWMIEREVLKNGGVRGILGEWAHTHGYKVVSNKQSYLNLLKLPYYLARPVEVPQLVVDIDFKSFQKIQNKRREAFKTKLLITEKDDFVPARIRHDSETIKVKMRLKGDQLDHLMGDKWSFRVKVKVKIICSVCVHFRYKIRW